QRPGHPRGDPRTRVLPAGVGPRGRQRAGPVDRAKLRAAARRPDRLREQAGSHRFPRAAAACLKRGGVDASDGSTGQVTESVWVVDDDQSIRWVLERALQRAGLDVRAFASAHDCLAALVREQPRVLVSDIRMPGENGLELLERMKERWPGLPVIIMTAFSDLESAVAAFQGGAFEYLPKPFDVQAAVELIRRAVDEHSLSAGPDELLHVGIDMLGHAPAMQEV